VPVHLGLERKKRVTGSGPFFSFQPVFGLAQARADYLGKDRSSPWNIRGYYDALAPDGITKLLADTNHFLREQPKRPELVIRYEYAPSRKYA
jgi:hypothetical protein